LVILNSKAERQARKEGIMSTQLTAVASLDGQLPTGPMYRSIVALDLEGSTMRTNPVKGALRRALYDLLGRALEAAAITGNRLEHWADRGDGVLMLIRPHDDVPKTLLLDQLIPRLATLVSEYNARAAQPAYRMRLRAVVHAGEVHLDRRGCYGADIDVAIRLLDSPRVKQALKQAAAPLVLVVSDDIYSATVCHGYVDADNYVPLVQVRVAGRQHRGWVHVPAPVTSSVTAAPAGAPWLVAASALAIPGERVQYPVAAIARGAG
jgi:hypothetical protein